MIKGVDIEASRLLTRDDVLTVDANFNASKYSSLIYYNVVGGRSLTISDLTEKRFQNAPSFVTSFHPALV